MRRFLSTNQRHHLAGWVDADLNYGRHVIDRFLRRAAPFDVVVDLGAGWGNDLRLAREICPDAHLGALEVEDRPLETLHSVADRVVGTDIESGPIPYDDEAVDVFIANQVLEHTKEIFWIMHEVSRCLRVGGHLIIGVPNLASLHNRLLVLFGRHPTQLKLDSAHIRGFTRRDLMRLFSSCHSGGYHLEEWAGSQFYPFPAGAARLLARLAPSAAYSLFVLMQKRKPYRREFLDYLDNADLQTQFYSGR